MIVKSKRSFPLLLALGITLFLAVYFWLMAAFRNDVRAVQKLKENNTATQLGIEYSQLSSALQADLWLRAANSLEAGKSVAECRKEMQDSWKEDVSVFTKKVALIEKTLMPPDGDK